jgi:UDP-N-acetyl-2-amino-2-deoxyglucuronate dehydrogenase
MGERVGIGMLGTGRWSRAHAAAAARSDTIEVVSCFSRSADKRAQLRQEFSIRGDAASLEALLADPGVDAVVISTPNDLHTEQALACVEAGKPVLVDKPVAVDTAGGLGLLRASRDAGVPVGVAHHARRLAGHRAARAWIDSGEAGTVRLAHGDFSNPRGAAMKPDAWYRRVRGAEAGVLIQVGIHQVDAMLAALGPATTVNARFEHATLGPHIPDAAVVAIRHRSGALSTVTSSWTTPGHYHTEIQATEGTLSFRLDHAHWTSSDVDDHGEVLLQPAGGDRRPYPVDRGDPLRDQLEELGRSVREGTAMTVTVAAGMQAMAVVEAAVESSRAEGAPVHIDGVLTRAGATDAERAELLGGGTPAGS